MPKHEIVNKKTGEKGAIMVMSLSKDNEMHTYSYDYIEDFRDEWALYESKPSTLTITVECESESEARRLQGELKEAQTLYRTWDNKNWEAVINGLKEEK